MAELYGLDDEMPDELEDEAEDSIPAEDVPEPEADE